MVIDPKTAGLVTQIMDEQGLSLQDAFKEANRRMGMEMVHTSMQPKEYLQRVLGFDEKTVQDLLDNGVSISVSNESSNFAGYKIAENAGEEKHQKKGNVVIPTFVWNAIVNQMMKPSLSNLSKAIVVSHECETLKKNWPNATQERVSWEAEKVGSSFDEFKRKQAENESVNTSPQARAELGKAQAELESIELAEQQNKPINKIKNFLNVGQKKKQLDKT